MRRHRAEAQLTARATATARAALLLVEEHRAGHISEHNYQLLADAIRTELNALER